jgi:hypothetical protein
MRDLATGRPRKSNRALRLACSCLLALAAWLGTGVCSAYALGTEPLSENFAPRFGEFGSGAGQTSIPIAVGVDPTTGDLYVPDNSKRINVFSPWGNFIRAFGWGVADGAGELQTCTTTCLPGLGGAGPGEFRAPWGVAVDTGENVYVTDFQNRRVQKFTPSGQFVLTFGGEVDKTQVHRREEQEAKAEPVTVTADEEDVCTQISGDECGAGSEGPQHGQIDGTAIALSQAGGILVPGLHGIQEFNTDGVYQSEISLSGKSVHTFAVDPTNGDLIVAYTGPGVGGVEDNLDELSPTGAHLATIEVESPNIIATDATGHVYVDALTERPLDTGNVVEQIMEFDSSGHHLLEFEVPQTATLKQEDTLVLGLGTNTIGDLYVANNNSSYRISFLSAYGPPPVSFAPPPKVPPTIESEYALSSDSSSAVVQSRINPHFWSDTTDYVQYGTGNCEVNTCISQPTVPGSKLTSKVVAESVVSQEIALSGLQPETTYHYRFVTQSSGGGPVFGPDKTFTTRPVPSLNVDCPNQSFRTGLSATLPDCRAYEMVSPIEKNGGDVLNLPTLLEIANGLNESSAGGEGFTYSSDRAFANSKAGQYVNQYLARRDPLTGWSTEAIFPAQRPGMTLKDNDFQTFYKFFSPDLSSAWLTPASEPPLVPGVEEGAYSLYKRDNSSGAFQTLATAETGNQPELQGVSADGNLSVFRDAARLTPDASSENEIEQTYEANSEGDLRLVSVLPDGAAFNGFSSVGSANGQGAYDGVFSSVSHAVSDDGSRVYWSETDRAGHQGRLYLRENADQEQSKTSGENCTEPEKACTVLVSNKTASQFWAGSADGAKALYTVGETGVSTGTLEEFNLEEDASVPIANKVEGVVGAGEDLSYVYFVSTEALAHGARGGQPNLYVRHEESISLIGTLSQAETFMSSIAKFPIYHDARVTPDGRHVVFDSTASLTGYDNADSVSNKPDEEVYVYDADSHVLDCVSCDRSGARPTRRELAPAHTGVVIPIAASIPGWENQLYASRVLSDDGNRVLFDSYTPLVPQDTNGKEDVYEWELAGSGDCEVQSPAYSVANGGCVSLISSGESLQDSEFLDASANGNDVFFVTAAGLLPQDPGSVDVYDARVDGGFPAPAAPPASCEGEACAGAPVPPNDQTPASLTFSGPGDLVSKLPGSVAPKKISGSKKTVSQLQTAALSKALKACKRRTNAKRRKSCESAARKRYRAGAKSGARKSDKGRGK